MKILFSPSEGKRQGGESKAFDKSSFCCPSLYPLREELLSLYQGYVRCSPQENLSALFGLKKKSDIRKWQVDIFSEPTCKAIERYIGVAYEYLKYTTLSPREQAYIDANTIIFSNLFGPVSASDKIPMYKLKQGMSIGDMKPEKFYNQHFSTALDAVFENDDVLDLRAGFYEKFYKLKVPYTTLKFVKNGKVLSHWAKAYRGIVLSALAKKEVTSLEGFEKITFEGLVFSEIETTKLKTQITYEIC